VCPLATTVSSI